MLQYRDQKGFRKNKEQKIKNIIMCFIIITYADKFIIIASQPNINTIVMAFWVVIY